MNNYCNSQSTGNLGLEPSSISAIGAMQDTIGRAMDLAHQVLEISNHLYGVRPCGHEGDCSSIGPSGLEAECRGMAKRGDDIISDAMIELRRINEFFGR